MSEDPIHKWERMTGDQLVAAQRPGPATDIESHTDTFFMIASNYDLNGGGPEIVVANLKSPLFKTDEHPHECFAFWFYFGTQGDGERLTIFLENSKGEQIKVIWSLFDNWASDDAWKYGTVEIMPEIVDNPYEYRVVVVAEKGSNNLSFVAVDEFEFIGINSCELSPPEADPNKPTTPKPTEPPSRKSN